ncbi:toxin-antitoxin system, toxin component [Streptomyces sp. NPDC048309]|uniref:toxin-antitoxin system, toxin component n=1 Tax=Streptomyces sp. NPDC048309 TaxID=3154618 RepID=UPI0033E566DF
MRMAGTFRRLTAALRTPRGDSEMRALAVELSRVLRKRIDIPVDVRELAGALCEEMSRRRGGRPVQLRFERFPDEIEVTGLWMEFHDFDLVIIEERAETVQQLVILGHELWHMKEGHRDHHVDGAAAAARALSKNPDWHGPDSHGPDSHDADSSGRDRRDPHSSGPYRRDPHAHGPDGHDADSSGRDRRDPHSHGPDRHDPASHGPHERSPDKRTPVWEEIALTVAARNGSHEADEAEAEDFGLHLASVFRSWVTGSRTSGPVDPVGRAIQASLGYRGPED